jgi:phospholipid/cholesterol/gamma-HCH transport system substrate-binding protein
MRNQKVLNFRVGVFVLITLSVLIVIIFLLSGEKSFFEKSYTLTTYFRNTAGLIKGAAVRLSGVRIGAVTDIEFAKKPVGDKLIVVTMKITKDGMSRISPDAKATIRTEGLLGDKYIEIIPGNEKPLAKLPDKLEIESQTPVEFASIIGQSGDLLANIISISESLDKIVKAFGEEQNIKNINKTIDSIRASSEAIQRNIEAIEKNNGILNTMIYGEKDKSGKPEENTLIKLDKTITKLDTLLSQISEGRGTLHDLVYNKNLSNDINTTVANLKTASANLNGDNGAITELKETMSNFREISEMLKGGEGTLGALLIDPSVYDSLKGILGEAQRSRFVRAAVKYFIEQEKAAQAEKDSTSTN